MINLNLYSLYIRFNRYVSYLYFCFFRWLSHLHRLFTTQCRFLFILKDDRLLMSSPWTWMVLWVCLFKCLSYRYFISLLRNDSSINMQVWMILNSLWSLQISVEITGSFHSSNHLIFFIYMWTFYIILVYMLFLLSLLFSEVLIINHLLSLVSFQLFSWRIYLLIDCIFLCLLCINVSLYYLFKLWLHLMNFICILCPVRKYSVLFCLEVFFNTSIILCISRVCFCKFVLYDG